MGRKFVGASPPDGSVGTVQLADASVTPAKLASGEATEGQTLQADGSGGVSFATASGGGPVTGKISAATGVQTLASSEATVTGASLTIQAADLVAGAIIHAQASVEVTTYTGNTDFNNYCVLKLGNLVLGKIEFNNQTTQTARVFGGTGHVAIAGASGVVGSTFIATSQSNLTDGIGDGNAKFSAAAMDTTANQTLVVAGEAASDTVQVNVHSLSYSITKPA